MGMLGNSAGGGTSFNPAAPGPIGGSTPAAITGTTITATTKFLAASGSASAPAYSFSSGTNAGLSYPGFGGIALSINGNREVAYFPSEVRMVSGIALGWCSNATSAPNAAADTALYRVATGVLAQYQGPTFASQAQEYQLYGARTDASNYERLALRTVAGSKATIAVETLGTGADNLDLELVPAGTGVLQISNPQNGAAAASGTLTNAPSAGNPAEWLKVKIGANVRYIPCWA